MATVAELKNLGVCGASSALGFNVDRGCPEDFKKDYGTWFLDTSLNIAADEELTEDYFKGLQKAGKLIVVPRISSLTDIGSDDTTETQEDDTIITTTEGKYRFEMVYNHSMFFNKALGSIEGFGNYRMVRIDIDGNLLFTEGTDGGMKGYTCGEIKRGKQQVATSAASSKKVLRVQLANRFEMDDNYVLIKGENLPFDPRNLEPVIQAHLSFVNAPANGDLTMTVKVVVDRGRKATVDSVLYTQFLHKNEGATDNPTAGVNTNGEIPLTISALATGESGEISLYDNSGNSAIIEAVGDGLYKSNTLTYTVVA